MTLYKTARELVKYNIELVPLMSKLIYRSIKPDYSNNIPANHSDHKQSKDSLEHNINNNRI
ncbi:hypothetical protein GF336_04830 [Candidatus Woesearchaeota archaeon]|nr:hypothetical protein [Candidatus Woesearchaeota archaeon]